MRNATKLVDLRRQSPLPDSDHPEATVPAEAAGAARGDGHYRIAVGRTVVVGVDREGRSELLADAAVVFDASGIVDTGPADTMRRRYPHSEVCGGPGSVVFPGFVNAHHHVGLTPFQLGSPDRPLELWLAARMREPAVDLYLDTAYSAIEMIESGITTVQHLRTAPTGGSAEETVAGCQEILSAYQDTGLRVSFAYWSRDRNLLAYEGDDEVIRRLGPADGRDLAELLRSSEVSGAGSLDVYRRLRAENVDDNVSIQLSPGNLHWCSDDLLKEIAQIAAADESCVHMHLLETAFQRSFAHREYGASAVEHLSSVGLLNERLTLGHGVWLSDVDIKLLTAADVAVCHNCSSNFRLRSGIAPVVKLIRQGIRVGIGIDEAGINDDRDMFQELRMVLDCHRRPGFDQDDVLTAAEVFRMATELGASTTGFGSQIGRLEPGRQADIVICDWEGLAAPYLHPDVSVLDAVLRRGRVRHVEEVYVAGNCVYRDGQLTGIDRDQVSASLAADMRSRESEPGLARRVELGRAVDEVLPAIYGRYEIAKDVQPHYWSNSRT